MYNFVYYIKTDDYSQTWVDTSGRGPSSNKRRAKEAAVLKFFSCNEQLGKELGNILEKRYSAWQYHTNKFQFCWLKCLLN